MRSLHSDTIIRGVYGVKKVEETKLERLLTDIETDLFEPIDCFVNLVNTDDHTSRLDLHSTIDTLRQIRRSKLNERSERAS